MPDTPIRHGSRMRWFLWSPAALMVGIGIFFSLPNEPPILYGPLALGAMVLLVMVLRRYSWRARLIPLVLIGAGFVAAQWREETVATPLLLGEIHNRIVEGTIDEIEPVEKREKLVLSHLVIDGVPLEHTPLRIRVSFRHANDTISVGDRVRFIANLYPLPTPIMPGSYDFARHFYFRSIGGNGFSISAAQVVQPAQESGWRTQLNQFRHMIGTTMRDGMPGAVGTVAAAMTVGETGPIPNDVKAVLRDSGLAHMLAIAGLHLGIVTGIVFYNVRLLLTLIKPLALRAPVKKIAAFFALLSGLVYLALAGGPIPAQRAFIMVVFLFTGIMLDRKAVTLRTLALAAMLILLFFPESMFGPSFQMSFAATLAIIALYEHYGWKFHNSQSRLRAAWAHLMGIVVTSLVATLSTAPFVLYHFNRFAIFGLLSNMVVVPLATFVIMPGMVLALLLMPFGLQWIGYIPLAYGTDIMIRMAQWVVELPYASVHLPSPTDAGIILCAFGLMFLCVVQGRLRFAGIGALALGFATIALHVPVDMLVSSDAHQVMLRLDNGHYTGLKGTGRSFNMQNWLRSEGEDTLVPLKDTGIDCDAGYCITKQRSHTVVMVKKPDDDSIVRAACAQKSDIVVAWHYLSAQDCPGASIRIGRAELENYGPHGVWYGKDGIRVERTRTGTGMRIWQLPIKEDSDMEE